MPLRNASVSFYLFWFTARGVERIEPAAELAEGLRAEVRVGAAARLAKGGPADEQREHCQARGRDGGKRAQPALQVLDPALRELVPVVRYLGLFKRRDQVLLRMNVSS
jgi:hypothetical protein